VQTNTVILYGQESKKQREDPDFMIKFAENRLELLKSRRFVGTIGSRRTNAVDTTG